MKTAKLITVRSAIIKIVENHKSKYLSTDLQSLKDNPPNESFDRCEIEFCFSNGSVAVVLRVNVYKLSISTRAVSPVINIGSVNHTDSARALVFIDILRTVAILYDMIKDTFADVEIT